MGEEASDCRSGGTHASPVRQSGVVGMPERDRCLVMGIVNATPDSFSDGSLHETAEAATRHALTLMAEGADLVDVGGESTRPHARRVPAEEELQRVLPVVRALAEAGVPVSVDTMRARVAEAALQVGAIAVNDVSGGLADPGMADLVAEAEVPYVAMHWRGHSERMASMASYQDVVEDVASELERRLERLTSAGVREDKVILDPGIGFAKEPRHDWELIRNLERLHVLGRPLLVGASRKSFLGNLVRGAGPIPAGERDALTGAVSALSAASGAYCVRVHDVRTSLHAVSVARAWEPRSVASQ